jgi:carbonic anhydrase
MPTPAQQVSRRTFLAGIAGIAGAALLAPDAVADGHGGTTVTPEQALKYLAQGSRRWQTGDIERRDYTPPGSDPTKGQWPFAAILSCADARVNPETIFDVREYNLFNVRNAGNVAGEITIGSLEYAVGNLHVPVILVLGHTSCGAVAATQKALTTGVMPGGDIDVIVDEIKPAIQALRPAHSSIEAIRANVSQSATRLVANSPMIAKAVKDGHLKIAKGVYEIGHRRVDFFT